MSSVLDRGVILQALGSRRANRRSVVKQIRRIRRDLARARAAYAGGLAGERESLRAMHIAGRLAARRLILSRRGRKIDLVGILSQRRQDCLPVWTIADPAVEISRNNGTFQMCIENGVVKSEGYAVPSNAYAVRSGGWRRKEWRNGTFKGHPQTHYIPAHHPDAHLRVPAGMPALPSRVRRLAASRTVRMDALWVGLLYQPESWSAPNPDPALVVEWRDLPGEYYALAVWGTDRPGIMEFVD